MGPAVNIYASAALIALALVGAPVLVIALLPGDYALGVVFAWWAALAWYFAGRLMKEKP